jgi:hypothetical protein
MGALRCGVICLLLSGVGSVASADDDFPVVEDPLLVPQDWVRPARAASHAGDSDDIAILEDTLLEPWETVRAAPTPVHHERCTSAGLLVPRGW